MFLTYLFKFYKASQEDSEEEDDSDAAASRLTCSMSYRRFIVTKCLLLLSGTSSVVKAGSSFCTIGGNVMYGTSASVNPIPASLSLGPLLFAEFCSHCYNIEQTSLASKDSSCAQAVEISLAQLSLRAFTFCVTRMTGVQQHSLSKASRVQVILTSSVRMASSSSPSSCEGWKFYQALNINRDIKLPGLDVPDDELHLKQALLPFVSLGYPSTDPNGESNTRVCLFSELLVNSMRGEAIECCQLIIAAAAAFSEPNVRQQVGIMILRCWESCNIEGVTGVLGLGHGTGNQTSCVSYAVDVALKLNRDLDGDTYVPFPPGFLGFDSRNNRDNMRVLRSKMGLPMTLPENWPENQHDRLRKEIADGRTNGLPSIIGIGQQVAWALTASVGIGQNFYQTFERHAPSRKQLRMACVKFASKTSNSNFARELFFMSNILSSSIETCLNNADYVTVKMIPYMIGNSLDIAQRFVTSLLLTVSKVISSLAPSAEFVDINGSFASLLLKSTKRLYSILVRLILSYFNNPMSLPSKETKYFLDFMISTLMPRVSALLFTIQEKQETTGGKFLAESKIESHGKISALLVFEKEKLDNALLKVGAKLKQIGLEEESVWLEEHVVTSLNRDFVIKRGDIQEAKEREAPKKKKSAVSKRKVKTEPVSKKRKKTARKSDPEEASISEVDDDREDNDEESKGDDASNGESCEDIISLGNLTDDMGEEDDHPNGEGSDDDGSADEDEIEEGDDESEAEFD